MELKGKTLSHFSKIFAGLIVVTCLVIEIVTKIAIPMDDVIKVALFVALLFCPIDISIWLEIFESILNKRKTGASEK